MEISAEQVKTNFNTKALAIETPYLNNNLEDESKSFGEKKKSNKKTWPADGF